MTSPESARQLPSAHPIVGAAVAVITAIVTLLVLSTSDGRTFVSADGGTDTTRLVAGGRAGAPTTLPPTASAPGAEDAGTEAAPLEVDGLRGLSRSPGTTDGPEGPTAQVDRDAGLSPQPVVAGPSATQGGDETTVPGSPGITSSATSAQRRSADQSATTATAPTAGQTATTSTQPTAGAHPTATRRTTTTEQQTTTSRRTTTTTSRSTTAPTSATTEPTTASSQTTTSSQTTIPTTVTTAEPTTTTTTTARTTTTTTAPTTTTTTQATTTTTQVSGGGRVVWEENFNSLDSATWATEHSTYGDGNNELQCYRPENVSVSGGRLILQAVTERYTCPGGSTRNVTSGMIRSKGVTFSPGQAIEFRVKLTPADPNDQSGLWPAVWSSSWGAGGWPRGGELDFLEVMTAENPNRAMFSMHYADGSGSHELQNRGVIGSEYFSNSWHTIRFDYGHNGVLVWHLDGQEAFRVESAETIQGYPAPFDQSIGQIKINLALGGRPGPLAPGAVGSGGATFEMDFIRILQL